MVGPRTISTTPGQTMVAPAQEATMSEPSSVRAREIPQGLSRTTRETDEFHIDPREIPDGWSYEWKSETIFNEPNTHHMLNLKANYWEPVPVERHPRFAPFASDGCIRKKGMILMERPAYLTNDAQQENYNRALGLVKDNQSALGTAPTDQFQRDRRAGAGVKTTYGTPMYAEDK